MLLKACVNGARSRREHRALPMTPSELAAEVVAVWSAGAGAVHLHVKDELGADTFAADPLAAVLAAVRTAAPGLPVGVTTGAWALPDREERVAAIASWTDLPAFASVNWHEDGADAVARALLERGVGVEAGLWHGEAVAAWAGSPVRDQCLRVLLELPDGLDQAGVISAADSMLATVRAVTGDRIPVLLHGEGSSCWPALLYAGELGLATRIGLEDTLGLPDGSCAPDNAALVWEAVRLLSTVRTLPR